MKLWVDKTAFEWLETMQDEGRTRQINVSTFRTKKDDSEIEVEVTSVDINYCCEGMKWEEENKMELSLREEALIQFHRWSETAGVKALTERDKNLFIIGYKIAKISMKEAIKEENKMEIRLMHNNGKEATLEIELTDEQVDYLKRAISSYETASIKAWERGEKKLP